MTGGKNRYRKLAALLRPAWQSWTGDVLIRRLVGNASVLLGGKSANGLFSLAYLALAARGLSLEAFGTLILVHTYAQSVGELVKFQSWQAVLTYGTPAWSDGRMADLRRVLWFTVKLDLIGAAAGFILAFGGVAVAQRLFGWSDEVVPLVRVYVISVLFMATATPVGILRLLDRFDLIALQSSLGSFVRLAGAALAFLSGAGLEIYLLVWFTATLISGSTLIGMALRELRRRNILQAEADALPAVWRPTRKVWRFVWSTNFNTTLGLASTHFGTLAVGALLGAPAAALYRVGRQLAEAVTVPTKLLTPAIYPELARLAARNEIVRIRSFVFRSALMAGMGATVLVGGLAAIGAWLLNAVAGPDYVAAYGVMVLLGVAAAVRLWAFPLQPLLISANRAHAVLAVHGVSTGVYLALLFPLCLSAGLAGAGIATLTANVLNIAGLLILAEKWLRRQRAPGTGS